MPIVEITMIEGRAPEAKRRLIAKVTDATGVGISLAQSGTVTNASGGMINALNQAVDLTHGGIVTNASVA